MNSIENQKMRFPEQNRAGGMPEAEVREDVQLLALIAGENQHALAALYRRRSGLLYSLLIRMLGNEMEAQEVLQDVFVQVWRRATEYDPGRAAPLAWMILIARGRAVDRLRRRSRRDAGQAAYEQEVIALEMEVNSARQPERDELAAACTAALHQLPQAQGEALQLAFLRGWTHEEIAAAAGEPLGTIKARIRRGLLALRQTLKDYHG